MQIPAPGTCRVEKWPLVLVSRTTRPAIKNWAPVCAIENRLGDNQFNALVLTQQAAETDA